MQELQTISNGMTTIEEGATIPRVSYFTFTVKFPLPKIHQELSDEEIVYFAELAGQFDFLKDPEEDIYSLSDGTDL